MSVMNTIHDEYEYNYIANKFKCVECRKEIKSYPFVGWNSFVICGRCCGEIKAGLMADMIQVAAVTEIRDLKESYRDETLVRKSIKKVAEEREKREEKMREDLRLVGEKI